MTLEATESRAAGPLRPVLVSKREACRLLGDISVRTLEMWINNKRLKAKRVGGRVFISLAEIEKFAS